MFFDLNAPPPEEESDSESSIELTLANSCEDETKSDDKEELIISDEDSTDLFLEKKNLNYHAEVFSDNYESKRDKELHISSFRDKTLIHKDSTAPSKQFLPKNVPQCIYKETTKLHNRKRKRDENKNGPSDTVCIVPNQGIGQIGSPPIKFIRKKRRDEQLVGHKNERFDQQTYTISYNTEDTCLNGVHQYKHSNKEDSPLLELIEDENQEENAIHLDNTLKNYGTPGFVEQLQQCFVYIEDLNKAKQLYRRKVLTEKIKQKYFHRNEKKRQTFNSILAGEVDSKVDIKKVGKSADLTLTNDLRDQLLFLQ